MAVKNKDTGEVHVGKKAVKLVVDSIQMERTGLIQLQELHVKKMDANR